MDRIIDTMAEWYLAHFEEPIFMLAQGMVLGLVIAGAVWLLHTAYESGRRIEGEEEQDD